MEANRIICGDALEVLATLPANSVQCVVTSPPYYCLRDYNVSGQIGLEETPAQYIEKLVAVFAEVRRVLRDDGLFFCNIGDSYVSVGGPQVAQTNTQRHGCQTGAWNGLSRKPLEWLKPKNLMMIPARVAIALQDDGWILRSEIVWHKPNAMPESVKDRPTKAHEMVYMFAKSERYYYDAQAIRENAVKGSAGAGARNYVMNIADGAKRYRLGQTEQETTDGRNARSVWTIPSQPFKGAHFACMPPKLAERCILASTRPGDVVLDPFSGAGTTALVANNLNRKYIGIELNPAYVEMSRRRLVQPSLDWTA